MSAHSGLVIKDLSFAYSSEHEGKQHVRGPLAQEACLLNHISLTVPRGTLACVLGPNGVGKSTLFRCILGLMPIKQGRIEVDGEDICTMSVAQRARSMAFVPQSHAQAFDYSVLDVVLMSAASRLGPLHAPGPRERAYALTCLKRVGAQDLAYRTFSHISGGERQLVLIARALAQQAQCILMDEPTSALDFAHTAHVMDLTRSLAHEGLSILVSTHAPDQAFLYADTILALGAGNVVASGTPKEVITSKLLTSLYGLEVEVTSLHNDQVRACVPVRELDRARRFCPDGSCS